MGKDEPTAEAEQAQEKDDIPASSKLDLDADQSAQTTQMLRGLIGSKDVDAMRMSVPAFIHQGDSALERNFMMWQPQLFLAIPDAPTPVLRMRAVVAFIISSLQGLLSAKNKKPFNPVMGEVCIARTATPNKEEVFYYNEQVSHHPPGSVTYYEAPSKKLTMSGSLFPVAGFTGTAMRMTIADTMTIHVGTLNEDYTYRMPTWYLRGIFFGKSFMDIVGEMPLECPQTGVKAVINFKAKPWFFGEYRKLEGQITDKDGSVAFTFNGKWSDTVTIKDAKSKDSEVLFNAVKTAPVEPIFKPIEEQGPMESQRLWKATADAIKVKAWKEADRHKNQIEERQRVYLREVDKGTIKHQMLLFTKDENGKYHFRPASARKHAPAAADAAAAPAPAPAAAVPHPDHHFTSDDLSGWLGALKL